MLSLKKEFSMNKLKKEFIFLGTGTSEGVPRVSCLTNGLGCKVCNLSLIHI